VILFNQAIGIEEGVNDVGKIESSLRKAGIAFSRVPFELRGLE
jgi:hypothetical protein